MYNSRNFAACVPSYVDVFTILALLPIYFCTRLKNIQAVLDISCSFICIFAA